MIVEIGEFESFFGNRTLPLNSQNTHTHILDISHWIKLSNSQIPLMLLLFFHFSPINSNNLLPWGTGTIEGDSEAFEDTPSVSHISRTFQPPILANSRAQLWFSFSFLVYSSPPFFTMKRGIQFSVLIVCERISLFPEKFQKSLEASVEEYDNFKSKLYFILLIAKSSKLCCVMQGNR